MVYNVSAKLYVLRELEIYDLDKLLYTKVLKDGYYILTYIILYDRWYILQPFAAYKIGYLYSDFYVVLLMVCGPDIFSQ